MTPATPTSAPPRRFHWFGRALLPVPMFVLWTIAAVLMSVVVRVGERAAPWTGFVVPTVVWTVTATVVSILLLVLVMRKVDRRPVSHTGLHWSRWAIPTLLGGVAISVIIQFATRLILDPAGLLTPYEYSTLGIPFGWGLVLSLASGFLMQGFPEELWYRGYLLQTLPQRSAVGRALISATIFAIPHVISGGAIESNFLLSKALILGEAFAFGLAAGALMLLTRQLWFAVGIHGGYHLGRFLCERVGYGQSLSQQAVNIVLFLVVAAIALALLHRRNPESRLAPADDVAELPTHAA